MIKFRGAPALLIMLALLAGLLAGCGQSAEPVEPLTVTLLSVGKADAIVLQCAGKVMVIDAGEADDGKTLVNFLAWQEIGRVDVLLITHFDRDHVGGAARLVKKLEVGRVLLPDYEGQNEEYEALMAQLDKSGLTPERVNRELRFDLGDAVVRVEPPLSYPESVTADGMDNDLSLIATVTHGSQRLLFMGDAERARLQEWLEQEQREPCGFLKLPHHGDYNKALPGLIETIRPQIAAVCDSDKNPAEERTLALLERESVDCYETRYGEVVVTCDGRSLSVNQTGG